ncbi:DUF4383 domain-containing protein [Candidatus Woesearchaeota archaeon]|nr:DUF4383 domain-containing protein [Candidatus Woesearchaeota archaeon]
MVNIADVQKTYAMVIGAVLVLVGILGFVPNPLVGSPDSALFGVNTAQNILHLVGGAAIVWFAYKGSGKPTNMWLGYVSGVVGILGFVPGANSLLASLFAINTAISGLHIAIGAVSLGVHYGIKESA